MRIESFWAKGFRSLRDVRLEGLGAFNVFYGPNGAGKSNILEAIRVLFQLGRVASYDFPVPRIQHGKLAIDQAIVQWRDLCAHDPSRIIVLGARCWRHGKALRAFAPPASSICQTSPSR